MTLKLVYSPLSSHDLFPTYSDADLSGNPDNLRSTAGYVIPVGTSVQNIGS
jgi:hypothetical protein